MFYRYIIIIILIVLLLLRVSFLRLLHEEDDHRCGLWQAVAIINYLYCGRDFNVAVVFSEANKNFTSNLLAERCRHRIIKRERNL